jgi:hypothetical protein
MFGLGKKKKKAKKAKKAKKSAEALTGYIGTLLTKAPEIEKDVMIKRLLSFALPKAEEEIRKRIEPVFAEAEKRGRALVELTPGTVPTEWSKFFERRKEEEIRRSVQEITPEYIKSLSEFLGELYKPEVAVTIGLEKTAPQWLAREWYEARPEVEKQFKTVHEQYGALLESVRKYLSELGIEGLTPEELLGTIWKV